MRKRKPGRPKGSKNKKFKKWKYGQGRIGIINGFSFNETSNDGLALIEALKVLRKYLK